MNQIQIYLRYFFFFFNDTATTEIYTLSLHDALPILFCNVSPRGVIEERDVKNTIYEMPLMLNNEGLDEDRKSTRLNSSHSQISYAVFCLKKKKTQKKTTFDIPSCSIIFLRTSPHCRH